MQIAATWTRLHTIHYASCMTARVSDSTWTPLDGAMPERLDRDKVYVIPTRSPNTDDVETIVYPWYDDNVRYLPKIARTSHLPVEFSVPEGQRTFLQEFSVDPELWSLGLAMMTMVSDWLILTVSHFISHRASAQGWSDAQAQELPLRVYLAETSTGRNLEIEGKGSDVIEALRILQTDTTIGGSKNGDA